MTLTDILLAALVVLTAAEFAWKVYGSVQTRKAFTAMAAEIQHAAQETITGVPEVQPTPREMPDVPQAAPSVRVQVASDRCEILKRGPTGELVPWHRCRIGDDDYHVALDTPGLFVQFADGSVEEGRQD